MVKVYIYESLAKLAQGDYIECLKTDQPLKESVVGGWVVTTTDRNEFVLPSNTIMMIQAEE